MIRAQRRRALPTLEDLREAILRDHPGCRRYRGGGRGAMHTLAQIVCDWATPAGQAIVAAYALREPTRTPLRKRPPGLGEWTDRTLLARLRLKNLGPVLDERELAAKRAHDVERLEALALVWALEDSAQRRAA
jgi:hypothetical protein